MEIDPHEANRLTWNTATKRHNSHKGDQATFHRNGGNTLYPEESALLGELSGKQLVHLQCNSGQDSLSIGMHHGATVTGVDISDEAIAFARRLSAESGIAATFVRSELFDWFEATEESYDVAFTTYGALVWLRDIAQWGRGVAKVLKPAGRLILVDFHPALGIVEGALLGWEHGYDYMGGRHYTFDDGVGDYVAQAGSALTMSDDSASVQTPYINPNPAHEFAWGLGEIVTSLINAGLTVSHLQEYDYCNGFKPFEKMIGLSARRFGFPQDFPVVPLMYSIVAEKRG